jgi:hypothetical protein
MESQTADTGAYSTCIGGVVMRLVIIAIGLLSIAALEPRPVSAQSTDFAYTPGTQKYRLITEVHREQAQGGGRAPFEFDVTTTQFVTMNLIRRTADTLALRITLDSVAVSSQFDAPQPDVKKFFGQTVHGLISPLGHVYSFDPPAGTTDVQTVALYRAFRNFLAEFPSKPLTVGAAWEDTVTDRAKKDGFDILTRQITSSKITGDTTVAGSHAWRVERHSSIAQAGQKTENGQKVKLTGDGSVTGFRLVSDRGVFLGSQSTQRIDLTMSLEGTTSAPITQTIKSTVEKMR